MENAAGNLGLSRGVSTGSHRRHRLTVRDELSKLSRSRGNAHYALLYNERHWGLQVRVWSTGFTFPPRSLFQDMRRIHVELRAGVSLAEEFVHLVERCPHLPAPLRTRSLQSLREQLHRRRSELYVRREGGSAQDGDEKLDPQPEVIIAAWKLVHFCSVQEDDVMWEVAGEFLAAIGIQDPHDVAFHLPSSRSSKEGANKSSSTNTGNNGVIDVSADLSAGVELSMVAAVLLQLQSCLVDSDVRMIELAADTLKGVLATEKGHLAYSQLSEKDHMYMAVHSKGVKPNLVAQALASASAHSESDVKPLDDPALWSPHGRTYEQWVSTLVHSLAACAHDPILKLCQPVALWQPSLAELLFPHVLADLAAQAGGSGDLCLTISPMVDKHLVRDADANTRAVQLLLSAMNSLRQCFVQACQKQGQPGNVRQASLRSGSSAESSGGRRSGSNGLLRCKASQRDAPSDADGTPGSWRTVYWLQLDYLAAAKAAHRCAAYFTAILYVEHWCEAKFERLTLGEPDFLDDKVPDHEQLLLDVYAKINEPDGIFGVARTHKVECQLAVYEHDGSWSKALESYDLLLEARRASGRDASTSKPPSAPRVGHARTPSGAKTASFTGASAVRLADEGEDAKRNWNLTKGLLHSLQEMGCVHVFNTYQTALSAQPSGLEREPEFQELQYEAAWRNGQWDLGRILGQAADDAGAGGRKEGTFLGYNAALYGAFKALGEGDSSTFQRSLERGRQGIVRSIARTSEESTQSVNPAIVRLQIFDNLAESWSLRWPHATAEERATQAVSTQFVTQAPTIKVALVPTVPLLKDMQNMEADWKRKLKQMQGSYNLFEPLLAAREVLIKVLERADSLPSQYCEASRCFRKASQLSHAARSIHELKEACRSLKEKAQSMTMAGADSLEEEIASATFQGHIEKAKLLWAQGQREMAVGLVQFLLNRQEGHPDEAILLCLAGKWLAETRSASSHNILAHLRKAIELVETPNGDTQISVHAMRELRLRKCRTHFRLAHYADALYRNHEDRLNSNEWQAALQLRTHRSRELKEVKKRLQTTALKQEDQAAARNKAAELQKQLDYDASEQNRLEEDRDCFLETALESYRTCLLTGDKYDMRVVFRLISLWFNLSHDQAVNESLKTTILQVPSRKFLVLVYQIASRMSSLQNPQAQSSNFQRVLALLVRKMAEEHPFHALYQLFALSNGDRVKSNMRSRRLLVVDTDKKQAAEEVLKNLSQKRQPLLEEMRKMIDMYIKLAETETAKTDVGRASPVPTVLQRIRQLNRVPIITAHIPVDPTCQYAEGTFPSFQRLSEAYSVMGGINAPKVVHALGSDGRWYRQLAKSGNDDLRQDAVMEQLFGLVNMLLHDNGRTRMRRLHIRTYKVIPFTPSAGVVEWVEGTVPLGDYLLGGNRNGGAHLRYGWDDWPFNKCRETMTVEKNKRKAFEMVCKNTRPVLHHFFLEQFARPSDWFERRLAYTRSVAASSMVGYIIGLGDRHSMNILLDEATAEVVHIDLGVAFEQGLMLKTPERVPFRLTREIVDGMGVCGVEGVFRRCCEEALSVMRSNKEALLTIIEVFIHDPLYKWALSPLKALQRQQDMVSELDDDNLSEPMEGNKDAARCLLRVKQKLDGYEEGEMRGLQGQVQQLIQDAQDPERLCNMFPGWGPWL